MAKEDQVQAALAALVAAEQAAKLDALNSVWDAGVASVIDPAGITPAQEAADIAAAVAAAVAPLNDSIAALQLAKAQEDTLLAAVKAAADALEALLAPTPAPAA